MLRFSQFIQLDEAISPIPGKDAGYEETHDLGDGHKVYVNIKHMGQGHHKVTALYIAPGQDKGTVNRSSKQDVPQEKRVAAVHKTYSSVKSFIKDKQWNSITLGGSDKKNKELYRKVGKSIADSSDGKIRAINLVGAGVKISKVEPIKSVTSTGHVPKPAEDPQQKYREQVSTGYSSSDNRSSRGKSDSKEEMGKGTKSQFPSGFKWKKKKNPGDDIAALSGASAASSAAKN